MMMKMKKRFMTIKQIKIKICYQKCYGNLTHLDPNANSLNREANNNIIVHTASGIVYFENHLKDINLHFLLYTLI